MTETQATYETRRHCKNCGLRINGQCTLKVSEQIVCLIDERTHWRLKIEHDCHDCAHTVVNTQVCGLSAEKTDECLRDPSRPHWRSKEPINPGTVHARTCRCDTCLEYLARQQVEPDRVGAQCTEKPKKTGAEQKELNRDQEGMPCDFCSHHINNQPSFCVSCDPENSEYEPYEFEVENQDTIKKNDHDVDVHEMVNPYNRLQRVLQDAEYQASEGKGKERHATDNKYEDQVICVVGRLLRGHPYGSHAYQIIKKTIEAGRLYKIKGPEAAYNEILGVINYAAAMNILIAEDK